MKGRIFSGVQPTHTLHLGNYLGAVRNWVRMQKEFECIFCVVDLHAITVWQDPKELTHNIREVTAAFMASGIDVEHGIIFAQSQVRAHAQLAWISAGFRRAAPTRDSGLPRPRH
jgi:tryptophanyl-tRNA synthetase